MNVLRLKLTRPGASPPRRATTGSVGYDVYAAIDGEVVIEPHATVTIPSGFAVALEQGYAAFIYARSGLGIKHGVVPANCVGVIDSDYRGEILVGLTNHGGSPYTVRPNDRIAQMVIARCELPDIELCDELDDTERGDGGFGHTG
ncbi:MAG: dUTP diphosphatase [Oscillospiraceae bacterium]|jgi:dUTP pyrophosphatase|nr:dUTP diphosphatase [Oscillospiraceae bacterium]